MISCTFENNSKTSLRHVCVNAIVVKDNKVLLGKRGTYKGQKILEYGKWSMLGGYFDRGENLEQAIKREVYEESGWKIKNITLLRINANPDRPMEDRQNVDIIFIATATEKTGEPDEESLELKWFGLDKLPPKSKIAFDHNDSLEYYKKYEKGKIKIPFWK